MNDSTRNFSTLQRRRILKFIAAGTVLAIPGWVYAKSRIWIPDDLPLTPQQTEGPFYPEKTIEQQLFNDTDLRRKLGDHEFAKGQQCAVFGKVQDQKGKPIERAIVEVWQACASGRYHHSRDDQNPGLLDNNFQFWGRAITGKDGKYLFKTIVPGKYPGRTARHIHFRIDAKGFRRCSTQCYFSDFGEDNIRDGIYRTLDRNERKLVTVEFDKPKTSVKNKDISSGIYGSKKEIPVPTPSKKTKTESLWTGKFDIVLGRN